MTTNLPRCGRPPRRLPVLTCVAGLVLACGMGPASAQELPFDYISIDPTRGLPDLTQGPGLAFCAAAAAANALWYFSQREPLATKGKLFDVKAAWGPPAWDETKVLADLIYGKPSQVMVNGKQVTKYLNPPGEAAGITQFLKQRGALYSNTNKNGLVFASRASSAVDPASQLPLPLLLEDVKRYATGSPPLLSAYPAAPAVAYVVVDFLGKNGKRVADPNAMAHALTLTGLARQNNQNEGIFAVSNGWGDHWKAGQPVPRAVDASYYERIEIDANLTLTNGATDLNNRLYALFPGTDRVKLTYTGSFLQPKVLPELRFQIDPAPIGLPSKIELQLINPALAPAVQDWYLNIGKLRGRTRGLIDALRDSPWVLAVEDDGHWATAADLEHFGVSGLADPTAGDPEFVAPITALDPDLIHIRLKSALQAGETRRIGFEVDGAVSLDDLSLYAAFDTVGDGTRYHLFSTAAAVPEPAGMVLMAAGLLVLAGRQQRRQRP